MALKVPTQYFKFCNVIRNSQNKLGNRALKVTGSLSKKFDNNTIKLLLFENLCTVPRFSQLTFLVITSNVDPRC